MSAPTDKAKVRLRNVRLSFPQLFVAKAMEPGKEPQFGTNFLLHKQRNSADIKACQIAVDAVVKEKWPKGLKSFKTVLKEASDKQDEYDGYDESCMVLSTRSVRRPQVVDRDLSPITEADAKLYAGCYVNATVRFFAYDHPTGGKGVSCEILAVQFAKDGQAFGGHRPVNVEEEFEAIDDDSAGVSTEEDDLF